MTTAADMFTKIGKAAEANPDIATSVDAKFQFNVTGDGGGTFVLNFKAGTTSNFLTTEPASDAQCIVTVSADDWSQMLAGTLDPMSAFMGGKVKVDGDLSLAMKLPKILKLAR